MAILHPFRAVRPEPDHAEEVACVPYDVVDTDEARALAEGKPRSFLHVIRPEIDLPPGTDEHAPEVYERGADNLRRFVESDATLQEDSPSLYVYRLVMNGRSQTGLFGCAAVSDYDEEVILRHEKTRPAKEEDRMRHILTQRAHAEPVMLTFRDREDVEHAMGAAMRREPLYDFTAEDGVQHTVWRMEDPQPVVEAFGALDHLYVADGHHRCKAASRAAAEVEQQTGETASDEHAFFPAVFFPMSQMLIMPYNRIVYRLGMDADAFLDELEARMPVERDVEQASPDVAGTICLYLDGRWHRAELPDTDRDTVADQLDVARLNEHVLEPLLGITDPRTDQNIDFVGGIRGTDELERRVDSGDVELAISMFATRIEELIDVSDAGLLMPPKSTWFEPKLRSGLLVHLFGDS